MRKGTNAHPQDKSEYQLPPPQLNILVPQDKLDVIMHPLSGQTTVAAHPPEDNFWNSPNVLIICHIAARIFVGLNAAFIVRLMKLSIIICGMRCDV